MKLILALLSFCFVISFSTQSCQKDNTTPRTDTIYIKSPTSILGLWIGTYSVTVGPVKNNQNLYYSYELHEDSTIQVVGTGGLGQTNYASGTWSLSGTNFSAHIVTTNLNDAGTAQTVVGIYDSTKSKLSGMVTDDGISSSTYNVNFSLDKVH